MKWKKPRALLRLDGRFLSNLGAGTAMFAGCGVVSLLVALATGSQVVVPVVMGCGPVAAVVLTKSAAHGVLIAAMSSGVSAWALMNTIHFPGVVFMTTDAIGGNSDCNYSNPVYDQMYLEQNSEMDEAKRLEIVHEMQKNIYEDAPYIPLYMEYYVEVYRADRWEGWQEWPLNNTIMSVYMLKHVKPVQ